MLKNKINKLVPSYAWITVAFYVLGTFVAFYLSRFINSGFHHFDITTPIDKKIPFVPIFIFIYILSYLQWFLGYLFICREGEKVCYDIMATNLVAKVICFAIFVFFPTTMLRANIVSTDIFSSLNGLIYNLDNPDNLLPSLHCLESWLLFRTAHKITKVGKWLKPAWFIFALLVFASVLFVKQHVILDIPAAIIVCEISLFLSRKYNIGRIYGILNRKILKKGKEQIEQTNQ